MNIYEILGVLAAVVTIIGFMWTIKKEINLKFDQRFDRLESNMNDQGKRIDKLYCMFVDLVTKMK
jgi:hypothetical protein